MPIKEEGRQTLGEMGRSVVFKYNVNWLYEHELKAEDNNRIMQSRTNILKYLFS